MTRDALKLAVRDRLLNVVQKVERALVTRGEIASAESWHRSAQSSQSALAIEKASSAGSVAEKALAGASDELVDFLCDQFPAGVRSGQQSGGDSPMARKT